MPAPRGPRRYPLADLTPESFQALCYLVVAIDHPEVVAFDEHIEYRERFTDTVEREWRLPTLDVCLLAPYGQAIAYLCLIARGDMVATFKRRVRFTGIVSIDQPIPFEALAAEMPRGLYRHLDVRQNEGGTVPPQTWEALVAAIVRLRPAVAPEIERLQALRRLSAHVRIKRLCL